ncbi:hypothetical protein D9M71_468980 [compost metagenome]
MVGIDHRLVVHRRVDGGDRHVVDAHRVVQQLEQRHAAVGGAGRVGNQPLGAGQAALVDAVDHRGVDRGLAGHRLREQHARRAGGEEALAIGTGVPDAGAFQHQVDAQAGPVDGFRLGVAQHLHALAVDLQAAAGGAHFAGEAAVGGVEAGQVFQARQVGQIVQRDDGKTGPGAALVQGAEHAATDAAVAVEGNSVRAIGHCYPL